MRYGKPERMNQRESRYVKVARIAYELAQQALPRYAHPKSPHHFTLPQLAACVLLTFYLDVSYRDMEEWLLATDQVRTVLQLPRVPDHSTLARTFHKLRQADWTRWRNALLDGLGVAEEFISMDTTNFSLSQASAYYQTRTGRTYHDGVKVGYGLGLESRLIVSWRSGRGAGYDQPYWQPLCRQAARYGRKAGRWRAWLPVGDMGFDGRTTRSDDLIPPQRRQSKLVAPERKARADLVDAARLDGLYGQRWQSETVNSVIKRKCGDTVRSRSTRLQRREPLAKGLAYHIHV